MDSIILNIKNWLKRSMATKMLAFFAVVLFVNFFASYFFFRIDLTSDKRYSISTQSKDVLKDVSDYVSITVYLDGEMPIGFKKLKRGISEMLDEFEVYGNGNIQVRFVNPSEASDVKERNEAYKAIYDKGVRPINIHDKDVEGGSSEKIVFPGAVVNYRGRQLPINFLTNVPGLSGEENLNRSIQNVEYNLINAIDKLSSDSVPAIAFIEGHGEWEAPQVGDITKELSTYYNVGRVKLNGNIDALKGYKLAIVAGGNRPWSEVDKFVLDQFIMKGGRVAFFVDPVSISADSLAKGSMTVAMINTHNLDDMLFTYGVRMNSVLLQDMQCSSIPVNVALAGDRPNFVPSPWYYFPLLEPSANHPISRNLSLVKTEFCSVIDTLAGVSGIAKSVLLASSPYSRVLMAPMMVSLGQIRNSPLKYEFNQKHLPAAVLLEGKFRSVFRNRMISEYIPGSTLSAVNSSPDTKIAVIADADIIRNDVKVRPEGISISPLGYDKFTSQTFGNKDFVRNLVSHLTDNRDLISLRNRDLKLRLLDRNKVLSERVAWQVFNLAVPVVFVVMFGILFFYLRKRKYGKPQAK